MSKLSLNISDEILNTLKLNKDMLARKMKLYTALHLFKEHKLTIVQSAKLADYELEEFMKECGRHHIAVIDLMNLN